MTSAHVVRVIALGLIVMSGAFELFGLVVLMRIRARRAQALKVPARIVDVERVPSEQGTLWSPVWEAQTPQGIVRATSLSASAPKPQVGTEVEVYWLASANPPLFEAGVRGLVVPIVVLFIGVVTLCLGVGLLFIG